jgi:hypothetical protein
MFGAIPQNGSSKRSSDYTLRVPPKQLTAPRHFAGSSPCGMEPVELSYWFGRCNVMKRVITLVFSGFPCAVSRQQAGRPAFVGRAPAKERDLAAAVTSLEKTVSRLQGQVQQLNLLLNSTKPQASLPSVSEPANVSAAPIFCGRCQASRTNSPDSFEPQT